MRERRIWAGGGIAAGGVVLGNRTGWWIFEKALEAIADGSSQVNWSTFPVRDAVASALILSGLMYAFWPKIMAWWKRPSLEARTYSLAGLTNDTFEKHVIIIARQAGEIAELRARLEKAGL